MPNVRMMTRVGNGAGDGERPVIVRMTTRPFFNDMEQLTLFTTTSSPQTWFWLMVLSAWVSGFALGALVVGWLMLGGRK